MEFLAIIHVLQVLAVSTSQYALLVFVLGHLITGILYPNFVYTNRLLLSINILSVIASSKGFVYYILFLGLLGVTWNFSQDFESCRNFVDYSLLFVVVISAFYPSPILNTIVIFHFILRVLLIKNYCSVVESLAQKAQTVVQKVEPELKQGLEKIEPQQLKPQQVKPQPIYQLNAQLLKNEGPQVLKWTTKTIDGLPTSVKVATLVVTGGALAILGGNALDEAAGENIRLISSLEQDRASAIANGDRHNLVPQIDERIERLVKKVRFERKAASLLDPSRLLPGENIAPEKSKIAPENLKAALDAAGKATGKK